MARTLQQAMELSFVGQRALSPKMSGHIYNGMELCQVGNLRVQLEGFPRLAACRYSSLAGYIEKGVAAGTLHAHFCTFATPMGARSSPGCRAF